MNTPHYCPHCGLLHGGEQVPAGEVAEELPIEEAPDDADVATTAIEAMRDVAIAEAEAHAVENASEAMADMAEAHADEVEAQADAVEAVAEALADVAEEQSEETIAEEAGDDGDDDDPDAAGDDGSELDDDEELGDEEAEAAPVSVPPQIEDAERSHAPSRATGSTTAWRRRRSHAR